MPDSSTLPRAAAREVDIELPADPALAITARMFVATTARHLGLDDGRVEDLRLATSELFTNGIEHGGGTIRFGLERSAGVLVLRASGVGELATEDADAGPAGSLPATIRNDLLGSLFPDDGFRPMGDGSVEIRVSIQR